MKKDPADNYGIGYYHGETDEMWCASCIDDYLDWKKNG